ncbi:MAG: dihydrodipicolinate synthase family protein [Acidimicrobiales bacterium]
MPNDEALTPGELATVVAITVTPFESSGALDAPALGRVVDRLVEGGISVLVPAGNTSEFHALSGEEWHESVALTVERAGTSAVVMPGVGRDLATAVLQAQSARELGCRAVMVHQPVDPFVSTEGWLAYHERIHAAAPDIALVAYVRDPRRSVADVARLAELDGIVGVKYAIGDPPSFAELAAVVDRVSVALVCGLAERWAVSFAASGATGFTSGLAGIAPRLSLDIAACLDAGDFQKARELVAVTSGLELLRARDGSAYNVAAVKEGLAQLGICGRTVRPPASELPVELRPVVTDFLRGAGLVDGERTRS